jgi:Domain of unknown function (DUF1844)
MEEEKKEEVQGKGFVVRDKRYSAKKESDGESQVKREEKKEEPSQEGVKQELPLPEISFTNLIISLSTSALIQLGEIQDPMSQQSAKNIPLAKQTIDLIGMLKEKTKGNLIPEEEKILDNILYDLRMRYVKATD